jgi:hypothetical protein
MVEHITRDQNWSRIREVFLWTIAVAGTSWGAANYFVYRDVQRIDKSGSEATQRLAERVTVLETEYRSDVTYIKTSLNDIKSIVTEHVRTSQKLSGMEGPTDRTGG